MKNGARKTYMVDHGHRKNETWMYPTAGVLLDIMISNLQSNVIHKLTFILNTPPKGSLCELSDTEMIHLH